MQDRGAQARNTELPLSPGGQARQVIKSVDWSKTPIGPLEDWPISLRSVVRLMLNSKFPMFLAWGEELSFVYNDAYAPILGTKHPQAMGQPFAKIWSEIWDEIRPLVDHALAGEATWLEDLPLTMNRHGYDEETYFTFSYSPLHDDDRKVTGMFCTCTETTKKVVAEKEIAAQRNSLMRMFEQAPSFIAMLRGPNHVFELANAAYIDLVARGDFLGKSVREVLPEVEDQGLFDTLDEVYRTGRPFNARGMPIMLRRGSDGQPDERFLDFVYQPVSDAKGEVTGIFVEGYDVTDRKQAEDHQLLLIDELNHRVKNMLAIVQGIAMQTLKGDAATPEARSALEQRFSALAATHKLLTRKSWADVFIGDVVSEALEPFQDGDNGISFTGPAFKVAPKTAITLALALHELATNAAKYGALSNSGGTIAIRWEVIGAQDEEPQFAFTWTESGGPPVEQPQRRGFGTRMIERGLTAELGGEVAIAFNREGIVCTVLAPLSSIQV